jgi:hypothetical protein
MRKVMTIIIFCSMLAFFFTNLDPNEMPKATSFEVCIGGDSEDYGYFVQQDRDGGYIIVGTSKSTSDDEEDILLVKLDSYGDLVWKKTFGTKYEDGGVCVKQAKDGGYIVVGFVGWHQSFENDYRKSNLYIVRTDSQGKLIWEKTFDTLSNENSRGWSVIQTSDEGFIIAGDDGSYPLLINIDSKGNVLWQNVIKEHEGWATSIEYADDSNYIIVGNETAFYNDFFAILLNKKGEILWRKKYGGDKNDLVYSVQKTTDNGYIIGGQTDSFGAGEDDLYLAKIDSEGNMQWNKTYGGEGEESAYLKNQVQNTIDGGYVVVGMTSGSFGGIGRDIYLVRTKETGDILWTRTYDYSSNDIGTSIQQTQDGGFIIIGSTFGGTLDRNNIILLKTDKEGVIENKGLKEIRIHPKRKGRT